MVKQYNINANKNDNEMNNHIYLYINIYITKNKSNNNKITSICIHIYTIMSRYPQYIYFVSAFPACNHLFLWHLTLSKRSHIYIMNIDTQID